MASDFDDYVSWRFRSSAIGINGSHRSDHPEPAPRVVVGRSGAVAEDAGRPARETAFEPGRFARAVERPIKRMGPGQYAVKGNEVPIHYVDLSQDPPCQCTDSRIRGLRCLHEIAALLQERDPAAMAELVDRFIRQQQRLRDAGLLDEE